MAEDGLLRWSTIIGSFYGVTEIQPFSELFFKRHPLIMALRAREDVEMEEVTCFLLSELV